MIANTDEQLERRKIEAEIEKLQCEANSARDAQRRGWLTTLSISAGILVSCVTGYQALSDIGLKNRQLAMESQIRSHQVFLNEVLDRMSGIKTIYDKVDDSGTLHLDRRERFGDVTQVGAYGAAAALACTFPNLSFPAEAAFSFQIAAQPKDHGASTILRRLKEGCPKGWDRLTGEEFKLWLEQAR